MKFQLQILGSNSAFPAFGRYPSAQVINHNEHLFLIDCGEGTQMQMTRYQVKRSKVSHIFISHLHGDHVFGLPGLLSSYTQLAREKDPMHIYGPVGIQHFLEHIFQLSGSRITYEIIYHEFSCPDNALLFENTALKVFAFPLEHRIETMGFRFEEKERPLKMKKNMIEKYQLTTEMILDAKSGADLIINGRLIPVEEITFPPDAPRSFAYCSDTAYSEKLKKYIKNTDVLYHETTFMEDLVELASYSMHSTAKQAAKLAELVNAGCLITGHYSSRYRELDGLLEEAKQVFPNTFLGLDGDIFEIKNRGAVRINE